MEKVGLGVLVGDCCSQSCPHGCCPHFCCPHCLFLTFLMLLYNAVVILLTVDCKLMD